ncbi:MAG: helix-turn-helix domain-containing protein [Solimonas sp.]
MSPANEKAAGRGNVTAAQDSTTSPRILPWNDPAAQRHRVLERLRQGPATTIELRRDLDCLMPAPRVHELRHRFGYAIDLVWVEAPTECGRTHRVGLYVLRSTPATEADDDPAIAGDEGGVLV